MTTECATRRMEFVSREVRTVVAGNDIAQHDGGGAWPDDGDRPDADTGELLEASLSTMVTLSDTPVVASPSTRIPLKLLFAVTLLSTPVTTADPVGWTKIPPAVIGSNRIRHREAARCAGRDIDPGSGKFRTTQFSMARFPPELKGCRLRRCQIHRWSGRANERCRSGRH